MELKFLGRGSAFNPKEGNTSAYFIENSELFLIDIGESVFERLVTSGLLENVGDINLMITHTHSDHIGSIGSLIMYSYYVLGRPLKIVLPKEAKYFDNIQQIISNFGCDKVMYKYGYENDYDNKYESFNKMRFVETKHTDKLTCYGLLFDTDLGIIYYSGDTKDIDLIKKIITSEKIIDKLYIDTTGNIIPGDVHLYIGNLDEVIPNDLKSKVYCTHINNDKCISMAIDKGYNVVETYNPLVNEIKDKKRVK